MIMTGVGLEFFAKGLPVRIFRAHTQKGHPVFIEAFDGACDVSLIGGLFKLFYTQHPPELLLVLQLFFIRKKRFFQSAHPGFVNDGSLFCINILLIQGLLGL